MRGRRSLAALAAVLLVGLAGPAGAGIRDDTDAPQAKLDAGNDA